MAAIWNGRSGCERAAGAVRCGALPLRRLERVVARPAPDLADDPADDLVDVKSAAPPHDVVRRDDSRVTRALVAARGGLSGHRVKNLGRAVFQHIGSDVQTYKGKICCTSDPTNRLSIMRLQPCMGSLPMVGAMMDMLCPCPCPWAADRGKNRSEA